MGGASFPACEFTDQPGNRIHSSGSRNLVSVLYATTSSDLFVTLLDLMSTGRAGRLRSETVQSKHDLRSGTGHGHGSVYDVVSARLSR